MSSTLTIMILLALPLLLACTSDSLAAGEPVKIETGNLPPRSVPKRLPDRPIPDWLQTNLLIGHLPPADWRMIDEFIKAGYNVITVNAMVQWYKVGPSAYMFPAKEVKQSEEYMRKLVDKIHKAGAKSIFYCGPVQVPLFSKELCKTHPEWLRIGWDGKPDATPNHCNFRSGYADWLVNQLEYVTREYGVDGYWFDGYAPTHLHTYDEKTKQAFREFSGGKDIPEPVGAQYDVARDPLARQYMAWHEQYFNELADRIRGAIRKANPEAVIYSNYSANRTWYLPSLYMGEYPATYCSAVDVPSVELYWDVPGDALYQQFVYAFMECVTRERGAAVWAQPSEHGITGVSSPVEIQLRGLEGIGWGVNTELVEGTGREDYKDLHARNIKARQEWMIKAKALPYIGIVASEQTRSLYAQGALPVYFSNTLGAFRAIFEKHWPVRILNEYDLEDADLKGVQVLMLPNVACLSDRAAEVIRRFVQSGGGLVATNETSLYDGDYKQRKDFALADLFKAKYVTTHKVNLRQENVLLMLDSEHPIINDPVIKAKQHTSWRNPKGPAPANGPLNLIADAAEVKALEGGQVVCTYYLNEAGKEKVRYPAIIASDYGRGRAVYFPASVDKGMFFYPDTYMRQMLANACLWAAHDQAPPLEVKAPLILSTTFRHQPEKKRYVVHLLNNASSWGQHSIYQKLAPLPEELNKQWGFPNQSELRGTWPIREEIIPLHDIKVICRIPGISKATLQPENLKLELARVDEGVEVTVPKLEMHSMVVFE